ncbi:hypothetical protein C1H46_038121 [Malus baccata]|uniref:Uncharacterized protein n=1 Tax=Malus baccata TaxID=106549 RepID=A0A540KQ48_MALBA|nr:hypothetical protein C1H46_038121 [Malus baccata]
MTKQQPSLDRRIQSLFPFALASLLVLGTARLVLDALKSNDSFVFQMYGWPRGQKPRPAVVISPEDRIDESCNVFEGKWVWDNLSHPHYTEESCPYLVKQVTCQRNGRPDSYYKNWRWQPNDCNLPRFDALKLMQILRGKRLMFVGDSVQRGQFESLVCMVQSITQGKRSLQRVPPRKIFRVEEFDASIEYYWAPFLVESISDHATKHTVLKRLVNLDSIANHGKHWEGVDILVFESYVWWMHSPTVNATSWEWKPGSDENCFNESYPIEGSYWGTGSNMEIMDIIHDQMQDLKAKVTFLNITQLSEYRKDAHTSVYGERRGKLLTKKQRSDPKKFADCIHWCLPGVPDTWNEILYAHLMKSHQNIL